MSKKVSTSIYQDSSDSDDNNSSDSENEKHKPRRRKSSRSMQRQQYDIGRSCKLGFVMFIVFILTMSDVFIERVMAKSNLNLVSGRTPTKKGICAQGLLIVIAIILLDFLICKEKI